MSATVGTLNVEVNLQLAKMQAQFDTLTSTVRAHTASMKGEFKALTDSVKGFFEGMIPAVTATGLASFTSSIIENAAQIEHSAEAARMSAESFQVFGVLARESGVGIDQLTRGLDAMEKKIEDASQGVKAAQKPFADLGLDWTKLAAMSPDRQFEAVARAVATAKDPAAAFADAMDILGTKAGPKLLETMTRLGTDGFDATATKAKEAGEVMSNAVVAKLDDIEKSASHLWTSLKNGVSTFIADVASDGGHGITDVRVQIESLEKSIARLQEHPWMNKGDIEVAQQKLQALRTELANLTTEQDKENASIAAGASARLRATEAEQALAAAEKAASAQFMATQEAENSAMMQRIKDDAAALNAAYETRSQELTAEAAQGVELWKSTRTAAEQYKNELQNISKLEDDNFIDSETANRARLKAMQDYQAGGADQLKKLQNDAKIAMESPDMPTDSRAAERARELTTEIDKLRAALEALKNAQGDHTAEIAAGEANLKNLQQTYDATEKTVDAQKQAQKEADELGHSMANTFVDGIEKGEKMHTILEGLADDLAKMAIQAAITKPLGDALGKLLGGGSSTSGASGSGSGGLITGILGMLAGAKAGGGPVEAGKPYLVGEQGPEVVVPGSSGTVLPNGTMPGGGGSVTFNNNFGGGVSRQDIIDMIPAMMEQQKSALVDASRRGGPLAQALGTA